MSVVADPDMVMNSFRLMRDGEYKNIVDLKRAIRLSYPSASEEQIAAVLKKLGEIARRMYER